MPRRNFELLVGTVLLVSVASSAPWAVLIGTAWAWHTQRIRFDEVSPIDARRAFFRGSLVGGFVMRLAIGATTTLSFWTSLRRLASSGDNWDQLGLEPIALLFVALATGVLSALVQAWLLGLSVQLLWPWVARLQAP